MNPVYYELFTSADVVMTSLLCSSDSSSLGRGVGARRAPTPAPRRGEFVLKGRRLMTISQRSNAPELEDWPSGKEPRVTERANGSQLKGFGRFSTVEQRDTPAVVGELSGSKSYCGTHLTAQSRAAPPGLSLGRA